MALPDKIARALPRFYLNEASGTPPSESKTISSIVPPTEPETSTFVKVPTKDDCIQDEPLQWEERDTCWLSLNKQLGKRWKELRIGSLSASMIAYYLNRVPPFMRDTPENWANTICGLTEKSFSESQIDACQVGIYGEPILRNWDSDRLGVPIREVGVAVWKENPIFRGSIDGEPQGTQYKHLFIEYKIKKGPIPRKLVEYVEAIKRGYEPSPGSHRHILDNHYDQMTQNGVILGKDACKYTLASAETREVYEEYVPTNEHHFRSVLVPQGIVFHDTYVKPVMQKHRISRIDPPQSYG